MAGLVGPSCWVAKIVPNIRIRPIWWTYANVCIRSRMIHNIRFNFFSDIHNWSQTKVWHTHTLSLTHTREVTVILSLSLSTESIYDINITQRHPSHRQNLQLLSLSRVYTYTQPVSSHMQNRVSLSRRHTLSLSHTHTLCTPYVYIYLSRMDFNHTQSLFTYEYDRNIGVWVWHEWDDG